MAVPDLVAICEAAAQTLSDAGITVDGAPLRVYDTEPRQPERLPAAWVRLDSWRRPPTGARQTQLGSMDWWVYYEVGLALPLNDPDHGQRAMMDVLATALAAFDANPGLGLPGVVQEAILLDGQQGYTTINQVQAIQVLARLEVWCLSS